ncbi:MAG: DinB family protein [Acidobacteria bacterium]|nr:DinB family protein [Acidobacteriota bacterium]
MAAQPVESRSMLPELKEGLDELRAGRAELWRQLERLPEEARNQPIRRGAWSPLQILEHVMLAEKAALRFLESGREPGPRSLKGSLMKVALRAFFALRLRARAPVASVLPKAEPSREQTEAAWEEVHRGLAAFLERVRPETLHQPVFRHPLVGAMDAPETLGFLRRHLRHHSRQLAALPRET